MLALQPRIPSVIGGGLGARELAPERMIRWSHAWSPLAPRSQAKAWTDGGAIDNGFPDEIAGADFTRTAAGPLWRALVTTMGSPAVETTPTQMLRTAAASLSISLPYSIVVAVRFLANVGGGGVYVGMASSAEGGLIGIFNALSHVSGGAGRGTAQATNTQAFVVLTWEVTADADTVYSGTTSLDSGEAGDATPTALGIGGYRDATSLVATQVSFLGITSGFLVSAHPHWRQLVLRLRRGV